MNYALTALALGLLTLSACEVTANAEADTPPECAPAPYQAAFADVAGTYELGAGSYVVPIDAKSGAPIEAERVDIAGETVTVTVDAGGRVEIESESIGLIVAQAVALGGHVALQVVDQPYSGSFTSASGSLQVRASTPVVFTKASAEAAPEVGDADLEITYRAAPGMLLAPARVDIEGTDRNKYYISMKKGPGLR